MKTFISDLIPKLKQFSQKLDDLALLTNQHWVVVDDIVNNKNVYIFRANNDLLISQNGKVEKAKWEYLGNNSLLIDRKDESYLFKHGFFDKNILALKVDSKEEYVFLINENKYDGDLNSIESVLYFLKKTYLESPIEKFIEVEIDKPKVDIPLKIVFVSHKSDKGILEFEQTQNSYLDLDYGQKVFLEGKPAPNGKYRLDFMRYIHIKEGIITNVSLL
ncbi:hypothetical protein [Flavobacterium sp.]|uniref:hypothetical protein n=1 Tax=Flavobacterium sp. TaxID=239 RepID=UPI000EEF3937|nr:hypothetical protein [Flavobacterium sp.]HCQ12441.1 hypothetical protein [Flavobacterium sp.]